MCYAEELWTICNTNDIVVHVQNTHIQQLATLSKNQQDGHSPVRKQKSQLIANLIQIQF
jgi:hypothetical protein